ncbi:MAG: GDP-4-dehydro-6-deoxy-D-mannose reductase [Chloroflexota bacterium]|jgi:GDP-4-dehydro-6-deoxy-D-mannose reductase|nr:GDP-4-dehydro-6-deoxy-D-mannose reductase [Chloroflexota bacterium]
MRVLVTGASGFVGRWLTHELREVGHQVIPAPGSAELDIGDLAGVKSLVAEAAPDVIAHLAAVTSGRTGSHDTERAVRTNIGGTVAITEAARVAHPRPGLLIVSSAAVYAVPSPADPPLDEHAAIGPRNEYGLLKLAQESVAIAAAVRDDLSMVVVRPFNHVGPDQPSTAVVASFVDRILAIRRGESDELAAGNIDVERDFGDVRDYAVAYRLIVEELAAGRLGRPPAVFNLATGRAVSLRSIIGELSRLASVDPKIVVDPELLRADDAPRFIGDASLLRRTIGWQPSIDLADTLAEMLAGHLA